MSLRDALPRWPLDGGPKSEGIGWDPLRRFVSCTLRIHRPPAGRRCAVTTLSHLWQFASACCSAPSSTVRSPPYGSTRRLLPETLSTAHFSICCAPWITHRWRQWAFCGSSEPPSCPSVQANCHFDSFQWRPAWPALVLFTVLAFRILPGVAAALAVWLFATAVPMVFFAADLKPYSFDVLAAVTVVLVVATATRRPGSVRTAVGIGLLGALAWFSSVVPFLLAGTGIALCTAWAREGKGRIRHLGVIAGLWLALAAPAVAIAIRNVRPAQAAYLHQRWADAFMPRRPGAASVWVWDTLMNVVGQPGSWELNGTLQYGAPTIIVALAAAGCWWMLRHHVTATLLLLLPAVVTLAASWLGLYPFTGRFILFLLPSFLIMVAAGTVQASRLGSWRWAGVLTGALVVVIAARATVRTRPPQRFEDLKPGTPYTRTRAPRRRCGLCVLRRQPGVSLLRSVNGVYARHLRHRPLRAGSPGVADPRSRTATT